MSHPLIIQGGMGFAISTWHLAKAVSSTGQLGVISGVAIGNVLVARLTDGDKDGSVRRALAHFPDQNVAEALIARFFNEDGRHPRTKYPRVEMWTERPSRILQQMNAVAAFVEVWLAKEGHKNPVGMNLLEKSQLQNLSALYGAMLAGVDVVLMGAGIPLQVPGALDAFAEHKSAAYRLDVKGAEKDDNFEIVFDPIAVFGDVVKTWAPLHRPQFYPIISSLVLAKALLKRANGRIDGFVVEGHVAGGHNAPPRGGTVDGDGEPVYGERDTVDLEGLKKLGLPFWLAGGFGRPGGLEDARALGAEGIQVGTLFAYCAESGLDPGIRDVVLDEIRVGEVKIKTDARASPTGFPFKLVQLRGSVSDRAVVEARERVCDLGILRHLYRKDDGSVGYRCPSEPVAQYVKKGGDVEDTEGRTCLCNGLSSTAGYVQPRKDGQFEPPMLTSGDNLNEIKPLLGDVGGYHAADVINFLTSRAA